MSGIQAGLFARRSVWFLGVATAIGMSASATRAEVMLGVGFNSALGSSGTYSTQSVQIANAPLATGWYVTTAANNGGSPITLKDTSGATTTTQFRFSFEQSENPANNSGSLSTGDGTQRMMSAGGRSGAANSAPNGAGSAQFEFTNLNTTFPSGYKVYVAFSDVTYGWMAATGTWYAANANYTADVNTPNTTAGLSAFDSVQYGVSNGYAFNGTWLQAQNNDSNANYVQFGSDGVPLTSDTLVLTNWIRTSNGRTWGFDLTNGIQLVAVPEPVSASMAGIALVGGILVWRRSRIARRRAACEVGGDRRQEGV